MKLLILACILLSVSPAFAEFDKAELLNLPLPVSGLRYNSIEALNPQWPQEHGQGSVCLWGEDKFAALSITIDDNNAPDIPFWQEMSEEFGWKFTWFVIVHPMLWDIYEDKTGSNTSYFGTAEVYKELYEQGHEISLHGSCKSTNDLDEEAYRDHIAKSRRHLESVIGNRILTYAYPCGKTGNSQAPMLYRDIIAESMIAARGTAGGPTPIHLTDMMNTKSMGSAGMDHPQTQKRFDMLQNPTRPFRYSYYRGWPVFVYHGLGNEAEKEAVRDTLTAIKAREHDFWIQPFGTVAAYAQQRASAKLFVSNITPGRIEFEVKDQMHDEIFNLPLTVKFKTEGWQSAAAQQADRPLTTRVIQHEGNSYTLVDVVPDRGPVILRETQPPEKSP